MHTSLLIWIFAVVCSLLSYPSAVHNYPKYSNIGLTASTTQIPAADTVANYNGEILTAEKITTAIAMAEDLCTKQQHNIESNNSTNESDNENNESVILVASADDLVYPVKWPAKTLNSTTAYQRIDLLSSQEEEELLKSAEPEHTQQDAYLFPSVDSSTGINMNDFVALIPVLRVQKIVSNYYKHDAEVKRAYDYFRSPQFVELKQQVISAPEMVEFLSFLNRNGLDLMNFLNTLANLTSLRNSDLIDAEDMDMQFETTTSPSKSVNEMLGQEMMSVTTEATEEELPGLHGLVDNILSVIPQDEVVTTFFDKLENDEKFSKLVNKVGTPVFTEILTNIQHSEPLRNLIFTLHNNGIYIAKVVDSLRAYFFLGNL